MRQSIANPTARAVLRPWPLDPTIAHLVLLDVDMEPTPDAIDAWIRDAFASTEVARIRTGALFPAAAEAFFDAGFVEVDRLALLQRALHDQPVTTPNAGLAAIRLRERDLTVAADIDRASFPAGWQQDATSLQTIATATPRSRRRLVTSTSGRRRRGRHHDPIGFAITGCAGTNGYLQRLAVLPDARRNGAGRILVDDALGWLVRRGAQRAMVNTGVTNLAAIDLYRHAGFERLRDDLVVADFARTA